MWLGKGAMALDAELAAIVIKNNFFWKHPFPKKEKGIVFGVKAREASLIFSKRRVQLDLVVSVSVQLKGEDNCSLSCLSYTSTS